MNTNFTTEEIQIKRQGCVLSPLLSNIMTIMTKVLDGVVDGVKINEKPINKIRYTDDSRK